MKLSRRDCIVFREGLQCGVARASPPATISRSAELGREVVEDLGGEVVAVAAGIAERPQVIAEDELGAFGYAEGAADRGVGRVKHADEGSADGQLAGAHFAKAKCRRRTDGGSSCFHFVDSDLAAVELADKVAVAPKRELLPRDLLLIAWQSVANGHRWPRAQGQTRISLMFFVFSVVECWKESRRPSESYSNYGSWLEHRGASRPCRGS